MCYAGRSVRSAFCYDGGVIYLFHGSDEEKVRAKAFAWVAAARAKEPNLAYARLSREEISEAALEDAALSGGLFVKRLLVLLDDPDLAHVAFDNALEALAKSENVFLILAPKLLAAKAKKIGALATKVYEFNALPNRETARGFNTNLVNALGARDAQKLWVEVVRALHEGDAPEMVHGLLHWKARDLMQKESRAWSRAQARALSLSLIALLQESRRKGLDLSLSLEKFALSV